MSSRPPMAGRELVSGRQMNQKVMYTFPNRILQPPGGCLPKNQEPQQSSDGWWPRPFLSRFPLAPCLALPPSGKAKGHFFAFRKYISLQKAIYLFLFLYFFIFLIFFKKIYLISALLAQSHVLSLQPFFPSSIVIFLCEELQKGSLLLFPM